MAELCDLVDAEGNRLGRTALRGTFPAGGEYFPVVHLWIMDSSGALLIQRRADHLASAPGAWATTAGYVQTGETGRDAAAREAWEEMGLRIDAAALQPIGDQLFEYRRQEIWLLRKDPGELGAVTIGEEVSDWRWATLGAISSMLERGEFYSYRYFHRLIAPLCVPDP